MGIKTRKRGLCARTTLAQPSTRHQGDPHAGLLTITHLLPQSESHSNVGHAAHNFVDELQMAIE